MSDPSTNPARQTFTVHVAQKALPAWITSGVMGLVLGGGGCFLVMYYHYGPEPEMNYHGIGADATVEGSAAGGGNAATGGAAGGGAAGGGAAGGGGMGGGMMGGGGMGGGMMGGGGGGPRGKRNLTSIVGKLDLATKGISFRPDDQQSAQLATRLADLDQPEKMTQEEAQERVDAIEALLTDEQMETLAQFEMPRSGTGGGGGAGGGPGGGMGGGRMGGGMGGGRMGGGGMGGGTGGGSDDSNPFQQEANQTHLHSLLDRLKGAVGLAESAKAEGTGGE